MTSLPTLSLAAVFLAGLTGCGSQEYVAEHPVNNQIPAMKPGVYSLQAVDVRPVSIREIEPDYPPELGSILTGKAIVVFTVRTDGKPADAAVVQADDVLFGEAALAALSKWRFHPAEVKGAAVDCRMTLPFVFTSPYGYYPGGESIPDRSGDSPADGSHKTRLQPN